MSDKGSENGIKVFAYEMIYFYDNFLYITDAYCIVLRWLKTSCYFL